MAGASIEDNLLALNWVPCIYCPIWFKKNEVQALINSSNKVNAIMLMYALKLGLKVRITNIRAQNIDGSTLKTFEMVCASFQVEDELGWT